MAKFTERKQGDGQEECGWMTSVSEWSAKKTYGEAKRLAADSETLRKMFMTHQPSDGTNRIECNNHVIKLSIVVYDQLLRE